MGDSFRLLFVTSDTRNGRGTDIADYDSHVQGVVATGHVDIQDFSTHFKVLGSTQTVNARDHTGTTHTTSDAGLPIYWLNGSKVADNYGDFYDGDWDSNSPTKEDGTASTAEEVYTGSNDDGTIFARRYLGTEDGNSVRIGKPGTSHEEIDSGGNKNRTNQLPLYGLSGVFSIVAPPAPELVSAVVDGTQLVLTYNEALDEMSVPAASQFTVTVGGTAGLVSIVDVSGSAVTLTLAAAAEALQAVALDYAVPASNPLQNGEGTASEALTGQPVTNRTAAAVPSSWSLVPSGLDVGDSFRLLLVTSTTRNGREMEIAEYDSHVQAAVVAGHVDIRDFSAHFKALGSTQTVSALDHTGTTHTTSDPGLPIYWLDGNKVADDYSNFYDGTWDSNAPTQEDGTAAALDVEVYTGSNDDGTIFARRYLGTEDGNSVRIGKPGVSGEEIDSGGNKNKTNQQPFYGLSEVFTVVAPPAPELVSAVVDGAVLVLTYNEALDEMSEPAAGQFTVTVDGAAGLVSSADVSGSAVTLVLASAARALQAMTVNYVVPASNPLQNEAGTAAEALTAQPVTNRTAAVVLSSWSLVPAGLNVGDSFRLLLVTSTIWNARSTVISEYDSHVQDAVAAGHTDIQAYSLHFRALASTETVNALDHTGTTHTTSDPGLPIYWLDGNKVADDYSNFYDGTWDSNAPTQEDGTAPASEVEVYTGSNDDGTIFARRYLGNTDTNSVRIGKPGTSGEELDSGGNKNKTNQQPFYGLSGVFTVTAPPNVAPMLSTAEVDGAELVLTYDEALDEASEPAASAYTVTVGGTARAVSDVDVTGTDVTLTLASAVQAGQTVTVTYAVPANNPVQDPGGLTAAALTDEAVTNATGAVAPMLSTAEVDGTELVLTYDEALDEASEPAASAYTVTVGGAARVVSGVDVTGTEVTLTLASAVQAGQTVTLSYAVPLSNPVQDPGGTDAAALTDEAVTNNTAAVAPMLSAAEVDTALLVLTYDEELDEASEPAASAYTVTVDGAARVVSGVDVTGMQVALALASAVQAGEVVTLSYAVPTNNPVQDVGGTAAGALTSQPVTNATPAPETVSSGWGLVPAGLGPGDSFRLLFVTSDIRNGRLADIATYDQFVQDAAAAGHADIQAYSTHFKVLGSTQTINARDHTRTAHTTSDPGVPIYWLDGGKVADDYSDFYDGDWASNSATQEDGIASMAAEVFTGSNDDGTAFAQRYLGTDGNAVRIGNPGTLGEELDSGGNRNKTNQLPFYGLSGVFTVVDGPPGLVSATVDGAELVLTYNEPLDEASEPAASAYTVTVGGAARGVSSVDVSGTEVTLTLATAVQAREVVTLSYAVPTSNPVQDAAGMAAAALSDRAVENNTTGGRTPSQSEEVPASWTLVPAGLGLGDSFRLLFVTSDTRNGRVETIDTYDEHVQSSVQGGHAAIRSYSGHFQVLGSTATADARDHTGTTHSASAPGVPIYWLGGAKVADDYRDLYDGSWDSNAPTLETGNAAAAGLEIFTGSNSDGTQFPRRVLGTDDGNSVRVGKPATAGEELDSGSNSNRTNPLGFYGLSRVFSVVGASVRTVNTVTLTVDLGTVAEDSGTVAVTVTASLATAESVDTELEVHVRDGSATAPEDFTATPNILDVTIPAGQQVGTASFTLRAVYEQDGDPECDESLIVSGRSTALGSASVTVLPARITLADPDVDALRCMAPVVQSPITVKSQTDPDPPDPPDPPTRETEPDLPQAAAVHPPTQAKIAIWTDRIAYRHGQPVRLYQSLHPMGDDGRYTLFYYLQRIGARRRFYFAPAIRSTELEDEVVDQWGFDERSFRPGFIKAVDPELIWAGTPRAAGRWQFVAEVRTADATQVVKAAYAKFTVTDSEFREIGGDGLPTSVSTDETWSNDTVYRLRHEVRVRSGATLTIEAGTVVLARGEDAAILVEQGARLRAAGRRASPVVMTCDAPIGQRQPGCWRGLALLGNAPANDGRSAVGQTQSGSRAAFGGDDPDDSSGRLRFVRVEFAGGGRDADDRPAAISLRGVGAGTVLNHVQAHESLGDGIEFRGGTVHCAYCVSSGATEDLLGWSQGWKGSAQHVFLQQGTGGDGGIDLRGQGTDSSPPQRPALYNLTAVGGAAAGRPGATGSGIAIGPDTDLTASHLIVTGFAGLAVEAARRAAVTFLDGRSSIGDSILYQNGGRFGIAQVGRSVSPYVEFIDKDPQLVNARYEANPDPRPVEGSAALRVNAPAADPSDNSLVPEERYLGAFGMTNWLAQWTFFGPESDYRAAWPAEDQE